MSIIFVLYALLQGSLAMLATAIVGGGLIYFAHLALDYFER